LALAFIDKNLAGPIGAGRVLLVVLALWSLAIIVPGLYRVFDPLGAFGLSADNDGVVTDVVAPFASAADSPAAVAGILPGDRINLRTMRCIPLGTPQCSSLVAVLGGLGGMQSVMTGRQIALDIIPASGGPTRTVNLQATAAPLSFAGRVVLLADTLVGIIVILIAFWLVWTRPSWMTWGLFLYAIWFNPGQSFTYYALLQRWPLAVFAQEIGEAFAHGAAFAGLILFALRFPHDRTEPRWQRVEWLAPLLGAVIAALMLLSFGNMFGFPTERLTEFTFLAGYAIDAAVLLILLERRRTLPPQDEQRMRWVIWGCGIGIPAFIFAEICQSASLFSNIWGVAPSQTLIGLLYLPNGVLAYFASQAVWQHRVVSVSIPLRHGTVLTALTLAVAVPIIHIHENLSHFGASLQLPEWAWTLVLAPVLLLAMNRLHEIGVELVDHVLNRRYHSAKRHLHDVGEAMLKAQTLAEIDRLFIEGAVRTLCLASGAVFRRQGNVFRRQQDTVGWNASLKEELHPESDALLLRSLQVGAPLRLPHEGGDQRGLPTGLEAPCLSVPLCSGIPEATAVALFGSHQAGNDIDADEREMLGRLATKTTAASERVIADLLRQQVAQLQKQLAELQSAPTSPGRKLPP
jgi:hypothetical protein